MAAQTGRLFQDQNQNAHISGAGTVSGKADLIGQGKARARGRKPLGDLSNTGKPINQADGKKALDGSLNLGKPSVTKPTKQLKSQNLNAVMNDEAVSAKAKNLESNRTTTANKASAKSRTGSRKALSDISNSVKAHIPEMKNKNSLKPSSLREEPLDLDAIAEEGFLHNHEECIKSQFGSMDVHHMLKTIGHENDSGDDLKISFELPAISKMKSESSHLELEEVPEEHTMWDDSPLFAQPNSPQHPNSPKLSSCYTMWDDFGVNLKLIDSPTKIV